MKRFVFLFTQGQVHMKNRLFAALLALLCVCAYSNPVQLVGRFVVASDEPGPGPGADADWLARSTASGVLVANGFDSSTELSTKGELRTPDGNTVPIDETQGGKLDESIRSSGASSLRFDVAENVDFPDIAGQYRTDLGDDFGARNIARFQNASRLYVQFRQRFDSEFATGGSLNDEHFKQAAINNSDKCGDETLVTENSDSRGFVQFYGECGVEHLRTTQLHGVTNWDVYQWSPARDAGLWWCDRYNYQNNNDYSGCFRYEADQWATFYYEFDFGDEEQTNTIVRIWAGYDGQPLRQVSDFYALDVDMDRTGNNQSYQNITLLPYITGKTSADLNAAASTWYDELIVSRTPIAAPYANGNSIVYASAIETACYALAPGASASFAGGVQSQFNDAELTWQTSFFVDWTHRRAHLMGKPANASTGWRHQVYDMVAGTWGTEVNPGMDVPGHIYGDLTGDPVSGNVYINPWSGSAGGTNRRLWQWTYSTGLWDTHYPPSGDSHSGSSDGAPNGTVFHPNLFGTGVGGLVADQYRRTLFVNLTSGAITETPHSDGLYGNGEAAAVYWPAKNAAILGGSTRNSGTENLISVTPNGGGTPTITTLGQPPIRTEGHDFDEAGFQFGSLHVHPGDPTQLLLVESNGSRVWSTVDGTNWTQVEDHPFTAEPRVLATLDRGPGCVWAVSDDTSVLWRPEL
jgi:hypothetical protein